MKPMSVATGVLLAILQIVPCSSQELDKASQVKSLPRSVPEVQGVSSAGVLEFIESADSEIDSMHSFILVRNRHVVTEAYWKPESANKPHILWSLSKSFTSTAVGLAIAEGKLSLDDRVVDFFPDDLPDKPPSNLQTMRVRDLLTMSAGHAREVNLRNQSNWIQGFLAHPVPHKPGSHFRYNTPSTFMLSAIVQKVTGQTVVEYLQPRLFEPLGIEKPRWDSNPQGITLGGYGLYLCTEDIAKFGQLYLQKGKWKDKQLVPDDWIEKATSKQVSNGNNQNSDWNQGYGFQFWVCRHDAYRGDGKDGQFCIVMPEHNAVVAITANSSNMAAQLNLVWDKLLPAMSNQMLPKDPESLTELRQKIKSLQASR